jgi:tetratricopeptide (TPR) repeat protein
VGEKYVLSGELVDPKADVTLAGFREESAGPDDSLAAIRRISDRIRTALGETPAPGESGWIPRVTTTKLRALQLFARADALVGSNDNPAAAEELLRQAVADDPKFASAWMHLAHALHNQGKPFAEVRACAEKAFQLSDTTSDRERYFIRGSYFFLMGEREKAIGAFEALRSLYPEHNWAIQILNNGLYDWKHDPRDLERAVEAEARWADANLTEFYPTFEAGFDFTVMKPDPARARPYLERARELLKTTEGYAELNPWLELLPSTQAWLKGDLETATAELNRVASTIDSRSGRMKDQFAASTALGYLTLGRLGAAEEAAGKITDSVTRNDLLAQIAFIKGDGRELRHRLQNRADSATRTDPPDWREPLAILEARTGLLPAARRFAAETERRRQEAVRNPRDDGGFHRMPEPVQHIVPGEIAFAEGNFAVAIGELEAAMRLENDWFRMQTGFYLGSESLAAALEKKGDIDGAIRALEQASDAKSQAVINQNWGAYWLRTRLELARAYRTAGRVEDARKVEADLQRLLAFADPEHPILRELQKPADTPSTATSGSSPTHPET